MSNTAHNGSNCWKISQKITIHILRYSQTTTILIFSIILIFLSTTFWLQQLRKKSWYIFLFYFLSHYSILSHWNIITNKDSIFILVKNIMFTHFRTTVLKQNFMMLQKCGLCLKSRSRHKSKFSKWKY